MMKWPLIVRRVVGLSMEPTLREGRVVFATPLLSVGNDDVVVAKVEGRDIIKRVSQVSPKSVALSGDNKNHSRDSRVYGEVNRSLILGKVIGV